MLHLRKFLVAGLLAATAVFASPTTAFATIVALSDCSGMSCDFQGFTPQADPTTGDLWIKFESAPGAGDKGHIEGNPGDSWQVSIGSNAVVGISNLFDAPFLTDMDQPIPAMDVTIGYPILGIVLDFTVDFLNPVFVHDIHFQCIATVDECVSSLSALGDTFFIGSNVDIVTGIWVPEPGTLGLFAVGLAGLAFARRRRSA